MVENKVFQLLGLAQRAGKVLSGEELVVEGIRSKKCKLVILAKDGSANIKKKVSDKCHSYNVPLYEAGDRFQLGHSIGKEARVVLGITDQGFANTIMQYLNETG